MSKAKPSNLPASIHQRLLNWSVEHREDPNLVLTRYVLERLLYRISRSEHADQFVLKGAMLFAAWTDRPYRPTRDLDLLGHGESSETRLTMVFSQVCRTEVEPDGLEFDASSIRVARIRGNQEYEGQNVRLVARLGNARITARVDVGFGDVITPMAQEIDYPTLVDLPSPRVRAYPRETVVAEKLQAIVALGMANSRMKDFYDLLVLAELFPFEGATLAKAVRATFDRRRTTVPAAVPLALTSEFAASRDKGTQWGAFLHRNRLEHAAGGLTQVIKTLHAFLVPALAAAGSGRPFRRVWGPGGPWS